MRVENKLLRDAAVQRTNHLASIRPSILLTSTYLGDYFLDSNPQNAKDYLAKVQDTWSRLSSDLANYRSTKVDEEVLVKRLGVLLDRHWQRLSRALSSPAAGRPRAASFYNDEILPLRTSIVEITSTADTESSRKFKARSASQSTNDSPALHRRSVASFCAVPLCFTVHFIWSSSS